MDFAIQRTNMVESQVRPSDVTDRRIIRAMRDLPREIFVPERVRSLAYMDGSVPLGQPGAGTRSLLAARVFAKLVQAAVIDTPDTVLDIGAGSGYSSAVLSRLAARVVALESDSGLAARARELLPAVGCTTVSVVEGDLAEGWESEGPYDAIVIEGAIEVVPDVLFDQLKDGGRLVAISGRGAGRATVWRREGRSFGAAEVFDATGDVLPGFEKPPAFAF
ncbi:protein-L-isoaspartate O-methyltransferase family protein [Hyphomicrobium sp.]|uniref:protein-L-isoaspartate O-methyltransferase family protein n=1 Tax=Hyphomicrobium sp. TaxID=82 RepID=UPI003F70D1F8